MLRQLITFCLEYRLLVVLLAAMLLVAGAMATHQAAWDVFPEFAPPQVVVQTEAPGLATEEVEPLVTVPIEAALGGISGIAVLRSSSIQGLSVVTAIFTAGTDVMRARQLVNERLTAMESRLPRGVEPPRMAPLKASTSRLLMVGLTSTNVSLLRLRGLADWTFRRRLLAVPGVAQVEVFGGDLKQYQILVTPQRLRQYDVTLDQLLAAARQATGFGGAGFLETANQRLPIRQRTRIESPADLAAVPVTYQGGVPLALGRLADVRLGPAVKAGDAAIDGQPGVLLIVHKQPHANTLEVTRAVAGALKELATALPDGVVLHPTLFRQASFVERAIGNLNIAILVGCVLVTIVLIAFLFQWRTVVISLLAIPLALCGALLVLRAFGASLNTMTLGGLAIALGALVDDAIVDVENVLRRLRENSRRSRPAPTFQVVLDASLEVRSAIVFASVVVILVFLPVFFLPGLAGTFFRSMGVAYVSAIVVSLLVAVTVTPALCLILLDGTAARSSRPSPLVRILQWGYVRLLPGCLRFGRSAVAVGLGLLVAAFASAAWLGGQFLPEFREANFVVFMAGKPDASRAETMRMGRIVSDRLHQVDGIISVAQQTGRADLSEDTWGVNISEIWVALDDQVDYNTVLSGVRQALSDLPGFDFQVKPFLRERVDEVLTGATADVVLRVVGPDLDRLRNLAQRAAAAMTSVPGVEDLRVEQVVEVPQIELLVRPRGVARYGLSVGQLNTTIQTLLRGQVVGQVYEADRVFDVVVRADPKVRDQPAALRDLLIDLPVDPSPATTTPDGRRTAVPSRARRTEKIPLRAVADVRVTQGPNIVNREGGSRRILVTCNAEGRDVVGVVDQIRRRLATQLPHLPQGYHLELAGEYAARQAATRQLVLLSGAALVGIFVFLYLDFASLPLTLLVMLTVPLASAGGLLAVVLTTGNLSLGSLVGFVTVFGIAVRNGILLVSHYQHLEHEEGMPFGRDLLVRGAQERLTPILMTALTTALALLPLVILGNRPGHEIEHPMAIVILGGLLSSAFLSLILLPILYGWIHHTQRTTLGRR